MLVDGEPDDYRAEIKRLQEALETEKRVSHALLSVVDETVGLIIDAIKIRIKHAEEAKALDEDDRIFTHGYRQALVELLPLFNKGRGGN